MGGTESKLTKCEEACREAFRVRDPKMLESALQDGTLDVFKIVNPDQDAMCYRADFVMKAVFSIGDNRCQEVLAYLQHLKSAVEKNRLNKNEKFIPSPQWDQMGRTHIEVTIEDLFLKHPTENYKEVFLFFLDNDDLFPQNKPGYSLLHQLSEKPATIDLLRELISSGKLDEKYKNSTSGDQMKNSAAFQGKTPLQVACETQNVEAVKELCSAGVGGKNYDDCVSGTLQILIREEYVAKSVDEKKEAEMIDICLCLFSQPGSDAIRKSEVWNDADVKSDLAKRFPKLRDVLVQNGCGEKKEEDKKDEKQEDKSDKTEEDSK